MAEGAQRLDRWLVFARFAKSRSLAAALIRDGHVRRNGVRVDDPSRNVAVGDVLTIAAPHGTAVVTVLSSGARRGPAPEARTLYREGGRDDGVLVTAPPSH